ncbi:MAG: DUF6694 family lipoprotein [Planctomycetota bacterium]
MVATLLTLVFHAGCSFGPCLDGSSPQSLADSAEQIRQSLSAEELEEFDRGLSLLRESVQRQGLRISQDASAVEQQYLQRINGLSAADVIAAGKRISERNREKIEEMFPHTKRSR